MVIHLYKKVRTLEELNQIITVIYNITATAVAMVETGMMAIDNANPSSDDYFEHLHDIEESLDEDIQECKDKVEKLGGIVSGLWRVDFDSGDGYYCWHFPEREVKYHHKYNEGSAQRRLVKYPHGRI